MDEKLKKELDECFRMMMANIRAASKMRETLKRRSWNGEVFISQPKEKKP